MKSKSNKSDILLIMLMLNAIEIFAMQLLVPSMPDLKNYFTTSDYNVQLTLTVFMFGFAVSQILYGPLSDKYGRKPLILLSIFIFIIGSILGFFSQSIETLIISRLIQSIGAAGGMVLPPAVIRDVYGESGSTRAIGWLSIVAGIAALLAPYIGGLLNDTYGWRSGMLVLVIIGIIIFIVSLIFYPESLKSKEKNNFSLLAIFLDYYELFSLRVFCIFFIILSSINGVFYAFFAGGVYVVVENLGLQSTDFGLIMVPLVVSFVISAYISVRVNKFFNPLIIIFLGSLFSFFSAIMIYILFITGNLTFFTLTFFGLFLGWGNGQVIPLSTSLAINLFPSKAGTVSAAIGTGSMLAGAIISLLYGLIYSGSPNSMSILMISTSLLAVVFCSLILFKKERL